VRPEHLARISPLAPAFELHEGTLVRVREVRGDVTRVGLENGLEGWVATGDLEPV